MSAFDPNRTSSKLGLVAFKGRVNLFPLQSKNLRRLAQIRTILYLVMMVVGFVLLGISMLKKH